MIRIDGALSIIIMKKVISVSAVGWKWATGSLTFTESGDNRSSSDAVDDDTGEESDDLVGRPIRFFGDTPDALDATGVPLVDELCCVGCVDCVCGADIETGGIL